MRFLCPNLGSPGQVEVPVKALVKPELICAFDTILQVPEQLQRPTSSIFSSSGDLEMLQMRELVNMDDKQRLFQTIKMILIMLAPIITLVSITAVMLINSLNTASMLSPYISKKKSSLDFVSYCLYHLTLSVTAWRIRY